MSQDNYALVVQHDISRFLQKDPQKISEYTGLVIEKDHIIAPLFNEDFKVNIHSGEVTFARDNKGEPSSLQKMVILHHLVEVKESPILAGEYVTIAGVKDAWVHQRAFENAGTIPLAREFSGRVEDFATAGKNLGGEAVPGGDHAFILKAFPMIPLKIIFWDGEEGIPPAANILFDKNITDFTHPEDVVGLGEMGAALLIDQGKLLR